MTLTFKLRSRQLKKKHYLKKQATSNKCLLRISAQLMASSRRMPVWSWYLRKLSICQRLRSSQRHALCVRSISTAPKTSEVTAALRRSVNTNALCARKRFPRLLICVSMSVFIQVIVLTFAMSVQKLSPNPDIYSSTCEFTRTSGRLRVSFVDGPFPTLGTSTSTFACIPGNGRMSARSVRRRLFVRRVWSITLLNMPTSSSMIKNGDFSDTTKLFLTVIIFRTKGKAHLIDFVWKSLKRRQLWRYSRIYFMLLVILSFYCFSTLHLMSITAVWAVLRWFKTNVKFFSVHWLLLAWKESILF